MTRYEAFHCLPCNDTGRRRNESQNIVNPAATVPCFCEGRGVVLVLAPYTPPWYAGERWPERDVTSPSRSEVPA